MKATYSELEGMTGFEISTKKGSASGVFSKGRIWVHHIAGEKCVKGIMEVLTRKFNTNLVTFTPLINAKLKEVIVGDVKVLKADDKNNPYGEDMEYLECVWK